MSSIDIELATLHARIAELEKQKAAVPQVKSLEAFRDEAKFRVNNNKYAKAFPLARFEDQSKIEMIEAVLDGLQKINDRMDTFEAKKVLCCRCGRNTHCESNCFAQRHLKGYTIHV
jgi:hypothetical protein